MSTERLCNAAEAAIGFIENLKDRSGNKEACDAIIKELRLAIRQAKKKPKGDLNMPETKREFVLNKIAEGLAHGLNSREIEKTLGDTTKAELVRCVQHLMEQRQESLLDNNKESESHPPRVVVFLDGGLIQEVYTDRPAQMIKIDLDIEGADDDEISEYPTRNNETAEGIICVNDSRDYPHCIIEEDAEYVERLFKSQN